MLPRNDRCLNYPTSCESTLLAFHTHIFAVLSLSLWSNAVLNRQWLFLFQRLCPCLSISRRWHPAVSQSRGQNSLTWSLLRLYLSIRWKYHSSMQVRVAEEIEMRLNERSLMFLEMFVGVCCRCLLSSIFHCRCKTVYCIWFVPSLMTSPWPVRTDPELTRHVFGLISGNKCYRGSDAQFFDSKWNSVTSPSSAQSWTNRRWIWTDLQCDFLHHLSSHDLAGIFSSRRSFDSGPFRFVKTGADQSSSETSCSTHRCCGQGAARFV